MFEEIREKFYESLIRSIKDRKNILKLKRDDILPDPTRVSKILKEKRDAHYPHLIGKSEYPRLKYLFLCEDHDSYMNDIEFHPEEAIKKSGNNYDIMLWGHINWDEMFQNVITELSEFDISEEWGGIFEETLVDYVPYAAVKTEKLDAEYAKIYIPLEEKEGKRQDAIKWVHLRHGSGLFKNTFYKKFSGKTLREFDMEFHEVVSNYLEERKLKDYSFGSQVRDFHQAISRIAVHWQKLPEVQYGDISGEKSDFQALLEEYIKNGREQIKKLEKYQQKFDAFHIDIK